MVLEEHSKRPASSKDESSYCEGSTCGVSCPLVTMHSLRRLLLAGKFHDYFGL